MKRLLFIYNPKAGRRQVRSRLADILDIFAAEGFEITAHPTRCRGDAAETAAHSEGFDRVICCGGDGTLNETVTGLMCLPPERRPVLGYIPTGSTNDFARNLSLPKGMENMARTACGDRSIQCDAGLVDGQYFVYVAAFGLFTDVSYSTPQSTKNLLGHLAYLLEGASRLTSIQSFHVKVETADGICHEDDYIYGMVGNTVSVGGLINIPREKVQLDDGLFEVLLIRKPKNSKDWQNILSSLTTKKLVEGNAVVGFPANEVTFTSAEPLSWTLDGEFGGAREVTFIENLPRSFSLACGQL